MTRADPGVSFRSMSLEAAWRLLAAPLGMDPPAEGPLEVREDNAAEVVESLADAANVRARRVLLDTRWWQHAGAPMLARLAERRSRPREATPQDRARGWVALVPHPYDG